MTAVEFYDPGGQLPAYPWRFAPGGWATRRQLRAAGLRPGGQPPGGMVAWQHRGKKRVAYLYLVSLALPVRPMTPAKWRAVNRALCARMTCPECGTWRPYCISKILGCCNECAADQDAAR